MEKTLLRFFLIRLFNAVGRYLHTVVLQTQSRSRPCQKKKIRTETGAGPSQGLGLQTKKAAPEPCCHVSSFADSNENNSDPAQDFLIRILPVPRSKMQKLP